MYTLPGNVDPPWRPTQGFTPVELPRSTRRWLQDEGSLTAHLVRLSGGDFRVRRLHQGWQIPLPSERRLLGMGARQRALVRTVALYCEGQPWVFARSVLPADTLTGSLRYLRQLRNQSLGALIFRNTALGRSPFEFTRLPAGSAYIDPSLRQASPAWARRSRFSLRGKHLLVSEVFLETFRPWPAGRV